MDSREIGRIEEELTDRFERILTEEMSPACQDCIYRRIVAELLPAGSVVLIGVRRLADRLAMEVGDRIRFVQDRLNRRKEVGP